MIVSNVVTRAIVTSRPRRTDGVCEVQDLELPRLQRALAVLSLTVCR